MYTAEENIGQELLSRVSMGDYRAEGYLWHTRLKDNTILIVTMVGRILIVEDNTSTNSSNYRVDFCILLWQCLIVDILLIEIEYEKPVPKVAYSSVEDFHTIMATQLHVHSDLLHLKGSPNLKLHHLPTHQENSNGLKLTLRRLEMVNHEQLIDLIMQYFTRFNSNLTNSCADIAMYLSDAGIKLHPSTAIGSRNRGRVRINIDTTVNSATNTGRGGDGVLSPSTSRTVSSSTLTSFDNTTTLHSTYRKRSLDELDKVSNSNSGDSMADYDVVEDGMNEYGSKNSRISATPRK